MIIKIYFGDQLIGEKPVKNFKSAAFYLLEQMVEHQIADWNFCEIQTIEDWNACFRDDLKSETAQKCRKIIDSGKTALYFEFPGNHRPESLVKNVSEANQSSTKIDIPEIILRAVDDQDPASWENIFQELKSRFDNDNQKVQLN